MMTASIPDESIPELLNHIYHARQPQSESVVIAHGFGIRIKVKDSQLVIIDGISNVSRERKYPKADRTLKRIVITGQTGYLSLEALKWCREHDITVTTLDLNGDLIAHYSPGNSNHDARILRAQVLAADTPRSLEIARELERIKLEGQTANLETLLNSWETAAHVRKLAGGLGGASNGHAIRGTEGKAATWYFSAWPDRVTPRWDAKAASRVPVNWTRFPGRSSPLRKGGGHRVATDPVNALLNYGYALGLAESRAACAAAGLDSRIGFIHTGRSVNLASRDSLALDILETIRPVIDAYVIDLFRSRVFTWHDFAEPYGFDPGTCRVVAPLTHELIEASYGWSAVAVESAMMVRGMLTA